MTDITYDLVSSTRFTEAGRNFFSSMYAGKHFTAEYFPLGNRIQLSMGFVRATQEQKNSLCQELKQNFSLPEDAINFDTHAINLVLTVREDTLAGLDRMMEFMGSWADRNNIGSGCFLCGNTDASLTAREVGGIRSVMCEVCREDISQQLVQTSAKNAAQTISTRHGIVDIEENVGKGILFTAIAAPLLGIVWLVVIMLLPFAFIVVPLCTAVFFHLLFEIYKRTAGSFSMKSLILSSGIGLVSLITCTLFCVSSNIAFAINMISDKPDISVFDVFFNIFSYLGNVLYLSNFGVLLAYCAIGLVVSIIARRRIEG